MTDTKPTISKSTMQKETGAKELIEFTAEELKALKQFPFAKVEQRDRHGDRAWVAINEDLAYPWALDILQKGEPPYITPGQRRFVGKDAVFTAARRHKGDASPEIHEARAELLDLARLYFTKAIHLALKERPGLGVHIVNDPESKDRWKQ